MIVMAKSQAKNDAVRSLVFVRVTSTRLTALWGQTACELWELVRPPRLGDMFMEVPPPVRAALTASIQISLVDVAIR